MSFLTPLFFLGVAALAAPILVHLVRRTRARKIQFPALVFVRQVPQRTIRRRTLQNVLLLLLRCLALLLIVIAFTRPFFTTGSSAKSSTAAGATVVLIDNSLSMRREDLFAEAQRRADATIDDAKTDEEIAVLSFDKRYAVASRFTPDKNRLRTAVKSITAGWDGTDYEQALRGAESLLGEVETSGPKRIVMISDFQAPGWRQATATFKLSNNTQLTTLDVSSNNPAPNLAITNVEARGVVFGQKYLDNLAVHISNFSDTPRDHVQVDFQINDQTVEKRDISLNSRDSRTIEFTGFNLNEGANRCTIDISTGAGANDFALDNRFYFTLKRETPAKALIVESATRGRSDSLHLQSALTTNDDLPFTFNLKSSGSVDPTSIPENALVILNDAGAINSALAGALVKFVNAGGQLIVSTGPQTQAETFNQSLGQISPASLREAVQTTGGASAAITNVKFDHPIFEVFQRSGRLAAANVVGYFRSEPSANATILARFEDGSPALLEATLGKGRVLLFTSSLGPSWNDLPLTPLYLPFIHQMVRYAGTREESSWYGLGQTFTVKKEGEGAPPAVDSPSGARLTEGRATPDGELLITAREPGFYRLRYNSQPGFAAVDGDGAEGDFSKLNFQEFIAGVTGGAGAAEGGAAVQNASGEEVEGRQSVWWLLLLVALLLLLLESALARRTKVAKIIG
ncbi:MAG TPA: BatA domain-containing protein [Pyrinomonadaceae bacterium]|nr:BatA domain-containing protein [Pyrinomonadaceae bacterium]